MSRLRRTTFLVLALTFCAALLWGYRQTTDKVRVGQLSGGGYRVATGQIVRPIGEMLTYGGRPVDLAMAPDGRTLYVKDDKGVAIVDVPTWKLVQRLSFPREGGGSLYGIRISRDGKRVWATGAGNTLWELVVGDGRLSVGRSVTLPGPGGKGASFPCGFAVSADEKMFYICLSRNNVIAVVDVATGKSQKEIPVGVAPYAVALSRDGKTAWVSEWGGRRPKPGEPTADSAGTPTLIDRRGVAASGTIALIDLEKGVVIQRIATGRHPSALILTPDGKTLYVANANEDTVSVVDTAKRTLRRTLTVKPVDALPYGSQPNALALSPDGKTLYVACGGNNAVAALNVASGSVGDWIPAGRYPGAVTTDGKTLIIASIEGIGSRGERKEGETTPGWNVYQYAGAINRVPLPATRTIEQSGISVYGNGNVARILMEPTPARRGVAPVPTPERAGEPSVFRHVVYIIKENRTYDQLFGDLKQGDGDPALCLYGRDVTPNHHALAEQFVLLDNFYCNGVLSADGHSWATEGNNTDHLEKAFGGFARSYTFGDDPITYSATGFIWDKILDKGMTICNFGEMDYTDEKPDVSYGEVLKDWQDKTGKIKFQHKIGVERLRKNSVPDAPGWNMDIPDVVRADIFLRHLKEYEAKSNLPNLTILYLPNDHTTGTTPGDPTPKAYLADNDLALGRAIEGISKSRFWKDTCIFVVEDDPQDGFDHVDGHRSICLVISPYTRRNLVVSEFYNQTAVLHTIGRILGVPAMNQMDALAPLMSACFQPTPDLRPYSSLPNATPLGQQNPKKEALSPTDRRLAEQSAGIDFRGPDRADEETLNRILWANARGKAAYPARFVGAHGSGLARRNLRLASTSDKDDETP